MSQISRSSLLFFISIVFAIIAAAGPGHAGNNTLVISTQDTPQGEVAVAVLNEACSRLGISVQYRYVPYRRSRLLAAHGQTDGELIRVEGYGALNPHLVRVPAFLCFTRSVAFAKKDFPIKNWQDLRGLRTGIIRGVILSENNTVGMSPYLGTGPDELFRLIDAGRLDVAVVSDLSGMAAARREGMDKKIRPVGMPLDEVPLYLYLRKNRADMVPKLAKVLQEMEDSGVGPAIRKKVLERLMNPAD